MRGLGRLIALPWLLVALALQGLAPAQAAAMPRDAFGQPICSAQGPSQHRRPSPAEGHVHDCCAATCALSGLGATPPTQSAVTPASFSTPLARAAGVRADISTARAVERPNARGPPKILLLAV